MACSEFGSYGLANHDSYKSKSLHQRRLKFIDSNRPCLKWEKAIFVISSLSKDYILCGPHLSMIEYFFQETLTRITPHIEGKERYVIGKDEDTDRINGKREC
jgi:hypothetical protein